MSITKDTLVGVLRVRYDAYSAEAVFQMACARAGLEGTTAFEPKQLAAFRAAVERVGDRVGTVLAHLDDLIGAKPQTATEPEPAAKARGLPPAPAPATAGTTIVLSGLDAKDGDQLFVCGAFPDLGNWDPELARPMVREGDRWLATVELSPDTEVAFKFLRRGPDGEVTWEPGGNRVVRGNEPVDATWRSAT
jgi:hypothetical protein